MLLILVLIIGVECFLMGICFQLIRSKYNSITIPKHKKTFTSKLYNATWHTFKEVRIGIPEKGELYHGGGSGDNSAIFECNNDDEFSRKVLICECID